MELRKAISIEDLNKRDLIRESDIKKILEEWGFDPNLPVTWWNDPIRPIRIFVQETETINDDPCKNDAGELCCADCQLQVESPAWVDVVVPNHIWRIIRPKEGNGGMLCFSCMNLRLVELGLSNVPMQIGSGAFAFSLGPLSHNDLA